MRFHKTTDCQVNMIVNRYVSEDGTFEIGYYRVIYGWRVRAGYVGAKSLEADYCCAMDFDLLARTLAICIARLEMLPDFSPVNIRKALPFGRDKLFRDMELQKTLGLIEVIAQ